MSNDPAIAGAPPRPVATTMSIAAAAEPTKRRIIGGIVALGSGAILMLAAVLEPSSAGLGTHRQLRLPPCGWIATMDLPCPTCGMTTSFAHAADGNLLASFLTQPLGTLLAIATGMAFLVGGYVAFTGSRLGVEFGRLWGWPAAWLLAAAVVLSWGYKVLSYKGVL